MLLADLDPECPSSVITHRHVYEPVDDWFAPSEQAGTVHGAGASVGVAATQVLGPAFADFRFGDPWWAFGANAKAGAALVDVLGKSEHLDHIAAELAQNRVRAVGPSPDTRAAEGIGRLVAQLHTMRRMSVSVAGMLQAGREPVVEASIVKDIGTIWEQQLPHRVRDLAAFVDADVTNHETLENQLSFAMKTAPKLTIQGGTTEVLRGIIARGLGLR